MTFIRFTVPSDEVRIEHARRGGLVPRHVSAGQRKAGSRKANVCGSRRRWRGSTSSCRPRAPCRPGGPSAGSAATRAKPSRASGASSTSSKAKACRYGFTARGGRGRSCTRTRSRSPPSRGATRSRRHPMLAEHVATQGGPDFVMVVCAAAAESRAALFCCVAFAFPRRPKWRAIGVTGQSRMALLMRATLAHVQLCSERGGPGSHESHARPRSRSGDSGCADRGRIRDLRGVEHNPQGEFHDVEPPGRPSSTGSTYSSSAARGLASPSARCAWRG